VAGDFRAMKSIKLYSDDRIAETSSKGNQEKWQDNGRWYKLDQFGYEGLAEVTVSNLLKLSSIERDTPFKYVRYSPKVINVHGVDRTGCSSKNFLKKGQSIVTLSHLFKSYGMPLADSLRRLSSDKKRIAFIAEKTAELTGLDLFPQYLTLMFEIDALFLNNDRHLNNIAVLEHNGKYDYCPIFDNGAALLSNAMDYPMNIDAESLIRSVHARPINTTFNRQMIHAINLYGPQLDIMRLTGSDIRKVIDEPLSYYPERDRGILADRVMTTIEIRQAERMKILERM
jgi:hypothetical protein